MLSKKRTNYLIISEILRACDGGAGKTKIVYQANLNFKMAESYLDNLRRNGCIETFSNGTRTVFKTTPKGLELKGRFDQFHSEMASLSACM